MTAQDRSRCTPSSQVATLLQTLSYTTKCKGIFHKARPVRRAVDTQSSGLITSEGNDLLARAIDAAISRKPKGHDFVIDRRSSRPALARHMSVTGG